MIDISLGWPMPGIHPQIQQVNNGEVVPKRLALSMRPPKPGDLAGIWEPVLVPLSAYAPLPASRLLYPRNAIADTPLSPASLIGFLSE